ncbi:MAG TPA: DUF1345 domain-containing protein [Actinomycetota bacterium]|jgi:uncharacterized membrane protein
MAGETQLSAGTPRSSAGLRVLVAFAIGIVASSIAAFLTAWQVAVLIGWDATAIVFLAWVFLAVHALGGEATALHATSEDPSRAVAELILISASAASLVGVGVVLFKASNEHGGARALSIGVAFLSVALSWAAVHTVFLLRYASLYHSNGPGGIKFPGTEMPDYGDFAYLALTIGMTYQVSDTQLEDQTIRRTALRHALLSFVFGTGILAMTINVVAGLVRP